MSREMNHAAGGRPTTSRPLDMPPLKPGRVAPTGTGQVLPPLARVAADHLPIKAFLHFS